MAPGSQLALDQRLETIRRRDSWFGTCAMAASNGATIIGQSPGNVDVQEGGEGLDLVPGISCPTPFVPLS
jgi:hypothetical protein